MKVKFAILISILLVAVLFFLAKNYTQRTVPAITQNNQILPQNINAPSQNQLDVSNKNDQNASDFQPPLARAAERVNKKPFGIYITPATSPVQPERFQGFHTGTDFEIFPEELNIDVPIKAICPGKLILKEYASGYGGVAIESCNFNNNPITVVYGHLKLASINLKANDSLNTGDIIGILGANKSAETDGERKHLHLGIHEGSAINIRGYVNSKSELSGWIDPCQYVCFN